MGNVQKLVLNEILRVKVPLYNEINNMLGNGTQHPTLSIFQTKITEVWEETSRFLVNNIKAMGEDRIIERSRFKNYLKSIEIVIQCTTSYANEEYSMFTEEFDAELYIKENERRLLSL